jgi:hypothetical protein
MLQLKIEPNSFLVKPAKALHFYQTGLSLESVKPSGFSAFSKTLNKPCIFEYNKN